MQRTFERFTDIWCFAFQSRLTRRIDITTTREEELTMPVQSDFQLPLYQKTSHAFVVLIDRSMQQSLTTIIWSIGPPRIKIVHRPARVRCSIILLCTITAELDQDTRNIFLSGIQCVPQHTTIIFVYDIHVNTIATERFNDGR